MEIPKYIVFRVDVMRKGTSVELTNITDEVEDVIFEADRKTEPQTCEDCKHWNDTEDGCADRHGCRATTEDCSTVEPQNYCDDCLYTDTCDSKEFFYACTSKATISKMEQVDKDINVRSKDEPTTKTETQNSNLTFETELKGSKRLVKGKTEPQTERSSE